MEELSPLGSLLLIILAIIGFTVARGVFDRTKVFLDLSIAQVQDKHFPEFYVGEATYNVYLWILRTLAFLWSTAFFVAFLVFTYQFIAKTESALMQLWRSLPWYIFAILVAVPLMFWQTRRIETARYQKELAEAQAKSGEAA